MKEHHKKLNSLINFKSRKIANKNKRLEVIIHAGDIYIINCITFTKINTTKNR